MRCELYERECVECGECEICDLDPSKRCDNCCACIEGQTDFAELRIDAVVDAETYFEELGEEGDLEAPERYEARLGDLGRAVDGRLDGLDGEKFAAFNEELDEIDGYSEYSTGEHDGGDDEYEEDEYDDDDE